MTIYDIADIANVSPSTVSRVLNGKSGVKKEKRDQILQLLQENNFNLKMAKQTAPTKCSRVVGIIVPDIQNLCYMEGAHQLAGFLDQSGFSVIIMNGGETDEQRGTAVTCMSKRGVEAIILVGAKFGSNNVHDAIRDYLSDIPVFTVNSHFDLPNVYSFVADEEYGVKQCVEYLYRKGRRKPLLLLEKDCPSSIPKRNGFIAGCSEYEDVRCHIYDDIIGLGLDTRQAIRLALAEAPECDAIICSDDHLAAYALQQMQYLGYISPEQISIVGMGNTCFCKITRPCLTSISTRLTDGCMQASQALLQVLDGQTFPHHTPLLCEMIIREST